MRDRERRGGVGEARLHDGLALSQSAGKGAVESIPGSGCVDGVDFEASYKSAAVFVGNIATARSKFQNHGGCSEAAKLLGNLFRIFLTSDRAVTTQQLQRLSLIGRQEIHVVQKTAAVRMSRSRIEDRDGLPLFPQCQGRFHGFDGNLQLAE